MAGERGPRPLPSAIAAQFGLARRVDDVAFGVDRTGFAVAVPGDRGAAVDRAIRVYVQRAPGGLSRRVGIGAGAALGVRLGRAGERRLAIRRNWLYNAGVSSAVALFSSIRGSNSKFAIHVLIGIPSPFLQF